MIMRRNGKTRNRVHYTRECLPRSTRNTLNGSCEPRPEGPRIAREDGERKRAEMPRGVDRDRPSARPPLLAIEWRGRGDFKTARPIARTTKRYTNLRETGNESGERRGGSQTRKKKNTKEIATVEHGKQDSNGRG